MRVLSALIVMLAGCPADYYSQGPCRSAPNVSMGDEGALAIYPSRLPARWPSGTVPAVAVGTGKLWIERYEACGAGQVRALGLDRLIDSAFSPRLAALEGSSPRWELLEATVVAGEEGEGTLTVTVEVDRHDEQVSDHILFRAREPADLALEPQGWAVDIAAFAREPHVAGSIWGLDRAWYTAFDGEPLSFDEPFPQPWTRADGMLELTYVTGSEEAAQIRLPAAGTSTLRVVPRDAPLPERVAAEPLEVLALEAITESALVDISYAQSLEQCFPAEGTDVRVDLRDAQGRAVHGGGALLTSNDDAIVTVHHFGDPDVANVHCLTQGTATLSLPLPNAPASVAVTVSQF